MWILVSVLFLFLHHAAGCRVSDSEIIHLKAYGGETVLLPCFCADLDDTPHSSSWMTNSRTASTEGLYIDVFSVDELRGRITLCNHTAPGNLSLLLSDLSKDDQGWYICWINGVSRFMNLTVESQITTESSRSHFYIITVLLLIMTVGVAVTCWSYRACKNSNNGHMPHEQRQGLAPIPVREKQTKGERKGQDGPFTHSETQRYGTCADMKYTERQDEYCSMYPIIQMKTFSEEVYEKMNKTPEEEYVSMIPQCGFSGTQTELKQ